MYSVKKATEAQLPLVKDLCKVLFGSSGMDGTVHWLVWESKKDYPVGFASARVATAREWGFLARAGILPEARGQNLQRRLLRVRLEWARAQGLKGCITYVASWNAASLINLLKSKFHIYVPEEKRRGKWRKVPRDGYIHLYYKFRRPSVTRASEVPPVSVPPVLLE